MPRQENDQLSPQETLASLFRLHQRIELAGGGLPAAEWNDLLEDEQMAWQHAYGDLNRLCLEPVEGMTYPQVAAEVNLGFQTYMATSTMHTAIGWDELPIKVQLKWKAMVRHFMNLLEFDTESGETVETHEDQMALWWQGKLAESELPEQALAVLRDEADRRAESPTPKGTS